MEKVDEILNNENLDKKNILNIKSIKIDENIDTVFIIVTMKKEGRKREPKKKQIYDYEKHKDYQLKKQKEYYSVNKDDILKRKKEYYELNKERIKTKNLERYHKVK